MAAEERGREELEWVVQEQAALRRVAALVAAGATETDLAAAVSADVARLFRAQSAAVVRWDGDTIRLIGAWAAEEAAAPRAAAVRSYGGDTIIVRVIETAAPARVDSAAELETELGRQRSAELGWRAGIGAPIVVDAKVWGVVAAWRRDGGEPFPPGDEERLRDFSSLVAQAIVNAEARSETASLVAEQSSLRQVATIVAAGRPQAAVLDAVTAEAGKLFGAASVALVRWEGVKDEVLVAAAWSATENSRFQLRSVYHPDPGGPTLSVLETGAACRGIESSPERGTVSVIAAPVITGGRLSAVLSAARAAEEPFASGAEIRLRSFADLAAQSILNERAQAELRASRVRIVQSADDARRRLERNLHDGAQQRLVSVSLALRLVEQMLQANPSTAHVVLHEASGELSDAMADLRELARGLHPAILTDRGLRPALEALADRSRFPVEITNVPGTHSIPGTVEAAIYYVVSESLTNAARHADASSATIALSCDDGTVTVEIADDGKGGASLDNGSGLRGLADRVEALGGELTVSSPHGAGTLVRAELPLREQAEEPPSFPPKITATLSTMASEASWEPVWILVGAEGTAAEEMLSLLTDEYGATGEHDGDWWKLTIRPIDQFRRGTIIYRVIQASRTIAARHPNTEIYLVTEDGNRWRLPPPALQPD